MTVKSVVSSGARPLILSALIGFLLVVLPTWQPQQIRFDTLDGGYRAVLNDQSLAKLEFGTDLVTTTGPLGHLRNRDYWPGRFASKLTWDLLIAISLSAVLGLALRRRSALACLLFAAGFLVTIGLVRFDIYRLTSCLPAFYVWARSSQDSRLQRAASSLTLICLAIGAWVLFSNFVMFTVVVAATETLVYLRSHRFPMLGAVYAALVVLFWLGTGNRIAALSPYVSNSLEIARGYTDVMLRPGGFIELLPGVLASVALVAAMLAFEGTFVRPRIQRSLLAAAASVIFYITFRSAFIRFEPSRGLELYAVVALWALFSTMEMSAKRPASRLAVLPLLAFVLSLGGGIALIVLSPKVAAGNHFRLACQQPGSQISDLVALITKPSELHNAFAKTIAATRQRFPLSHIDGPVDMHGNLQGIMIANDLEYEPRPVFQSFTAYTSRLIQLNVDFLRRRSPATIVVEMRRALGFPEGLLDAGAWLQLFESYEPQEIIEGGFDTPPDGLLVARRRAKSSRFEATRISSGTYPFGSVIAIPEEHVGAPIWAVVDDTQTPLGKMGTTFLKLPILFIDLSLKDGKRWTFKFSASPARYGFLLSPQIRSVHEIRDLMNLGLDRAQPARVVTSVSFRQQESPFSPLVRRGVRVSLYALARADSAPDL